MRTCLAAALLLGGPSIAAAEARAPATARGVSSGGAAVAGATAPRPDASQAAAPRPGWLGFSAVALEAPGEPGGDSGSSRPSQGGVRVTAVAPGGPAQEAGLHPGDVIVALDEEPVMRPEQLARALTGRAAGEDVRLVVLRGQAPLVLRARLAPAPAPPQGPRVLGRVVAPTAAAEGLSLRFLGDRRRPWLGLAALPLSEQLARYFGAEAGVLVETIFPGSPAEAAGLHVGDVIVAVGATPVACPTSLQEALLARAPGERVRLRILRDGDALQLDVVLSARAVPTWLAGPARAPAPGTGDEGRGASSRAGRPGGGVEPSGALKRSAPSPLALSPRTAGRSVAPDRSSSRP